jgi:putative ABC transport system permease protein
MMTMLSDLRLGLRIFLRTPTTALAAVLSLALGIGANTAIFSVLHAVVLRPLPYTSPDGLVMVWETNADNPERWVAPANFVDWRRTATSFTSLAAFDEFRPTMSAGGEPEVVRALGVSGTFFPTLGVAAAFGRALTAEDDGTDAEAVAVISDGLWRRAFAANPAAVGGTLSLDGRVHTIVGVMSPEFESPLQSSAIDVWVNGDRGVPRTFPFRGDVTAVRDSHLLFVLGRLAPGTSRAGAQQELTGIMAQLSQQYPDTNAGLGVNVRSLHEQVVGNARSLMVLLQMAVAMLLLIACANVAHLLLGQATGRQSEMTTRLALGASTRRLVRQMFAETLTIAAPGAALGILLAQWGVSALIAARPQALPRIDEIGIDATVLGFALLLMFATIVIFGIGPALHIARHAAALQSPSHVRVIGPRSVRRWHQAIVVTELTLAHVLLIGAGLLFASFLAAQRVPLGFLTEGRIAGDLNLAAERYLRPASPNSQQIDARPKQQFVANVLSRLRSMPGTRAVAAAFTSPLTGAPNRGLSIVGRPPKPQGLQDTADFQVITEDYFRAIGATLMRGRAFTERDDANSQPVAIVNQAFVDKYFPNEDPIGRQFLFGNALTHEIVGVVADMRYRFLETPADPTFYLPMSQNSERWPFLSFTVWSDADPATAMSALRTAVREADPNQPLMRVRHFDDILGAALAMRRFNTLLVIAFAITALALAAVGTYGVMAYGVSVRTRELGVRAALGASPRDLRQLIVREGAKLTAAAVAAGLGGAYIAAGLIRAMLFEVTPHDIRTFVVVAIALSLVALLATWIPARRALRVDPALAIRDAG